MKKLLSATFFMVLFSGVFAQDSTTVRWYVKGSETFYIRLDGELLPLKNNHTIAQGNYEVEIYSPKYQVFKGQLSTGNKTNLNYVAELSFDPEYRNYLDDYDKYKRTITRRQSIPALVGIVGIASSPFFYFRAKTMHQEFQQKAFLSNYLPQQTARDNFRAKYISNQTMFVTTATMAVGGTLTYLLLRKSTNAISKPTYKQQNPFTLEYFEMSYNTNYNAPIAGLTLTF